MGISYDKIYLNVERPKRAQVVLVALPMYRYRVEMSVYEHGLNFFQKQLLRLKARPLLTEERIADLLGIHVNIIFRVHTELENKGLLNAHGELTDSGREKLNDLEGLVVNSRKKTMGYVFQYVDTGKLHPQVVHQLQSANLIDGTDGERPKVNDRTKGDEDSNGSRVTYLEALLRKSGEFPAPEERIIAQMVLNTAKRSADGESAVGKSLGVRFMDRNPELVWVCTYIFLPKVQEDYYASDWKVLDPFGQGDSHEEDGSSADLRYYLKDLDDKFLNEQMSNVFDGRKTIGGKKRSEYLEEMDKRVEKCVESEMIGLDRLDKHISDAARQVVRCYLEWSDSGFRDQRLVKWMAVEMIRAIESMLGADKHNRQKDYDGLSQKNRDATAWRTTIQRGFQQHFKEELTSDMWWFSKTKKSDFRYSSGQLETPKGFAEKLWGFIASTADRSANRITRASKGKLKDLHAINSIRNQMHGTTEHDDRKDVTKEEGIHFYEVFKRMMNDYAKNA